MKELLLEPDEVSWGVELHHWAEGENSIVYYCETPMGRLDWDNSDFMPWRSRWASTHVRHHGGIEFFGDNPLEPSVAAVLNFRALAYPPTGTSEKAHVAR